jgi:hypothetical protein
MHPTPLKLDGIKKDPRMKYVTDQERIEIIKLLTEK